MEVAAVCERYADQLLGQPANAITSAALVAAGAAILVGRHRSRNQRDLRVRDRQTVVYAILVSGIGVGSFIQHGPHPDWQAYAHDLPLAAVLVFVATDAVSDITERELSPLWWLLPTVAMLPVVAFGATPSTIVQAVVAVVAIGLNLVRARVRPGLRKTLYAALLILAAGSLVGALTDRTSLCSGDRLLHTHAVWHVLAAAALWRLAPAIGARRRPSSLARSTLTPSMTTCSTRRDID